MISLIKPFLFCVVFSVFVPSAFAVCPDDPNCLNNPGGMGSPYKPDGLNSFYSKYGSAYRNKSATNPYATDAQKLYDSKGNYRDRLLKKSVFALK